MKKKSFLLVALFSIVVSTGLFNRVYAAAWTCGDTLSDTRDSKTYSTVLIGTQCWMRDNLNVGTKITSCTNGYAGVCTAGGDTVQNQGTSCESIQKYCYSDNEANCTTYGGLYQWDQAMCGSATEGAQGICPTGWHIPADAEQYTLENYLKDEGQTCNSGRVNTYDCATAGTKLKSGGTSNFNGLLAGDRRTDGSFAWLSFYAYFRSSLQSDASAWYRNLYSDSSTVARYLNNKAFGFSVRCLQDPPSIVSVTTTTPDGTYGVDDTIDVTVNFSEAVTSVGNVTVTFDTGRSCAFSISNATSGSCSYAVQQGDTSSDLTTTSISGTIANQASNPVVDFTPASNLAENSNIVIATVIDVPSGGGHRGGPGRGGAAPVTEDGRRRVNPEEITWRSDLIVPEESSSEQPATTEGKPEEEHIVSSPWSDLSSSDPHAQAALALFDRGILQGNDDGTVRLDAPLSRIEALTLLLRSEGDPIDPAWIAVFADTEPDAWYTFILGNAVHKNLIQGYDDGTFRPAQSLNLAESLKLLTIALNLATQEEAISADSWYLPYLDAAAKENIIETNDNPSRTVTRGEFAEFLMKVIGE